jgi:hypothetical protein
MYTWEYLVSGNKMLEEKICGNTQCNYQKACHNQPVWIEDGGNQHPKTEDHHPNWVLTCTGMYQPRSQ